MTGVQTCALPIYHLLNAINDIQTIITCTGLDDFVNNRFKIDKIFKVIDGAVVSEN